MVTLSPITATNGSLTQNVRELANENEIIGSDSPDVLRKAMIQLRSPIFLSAILFN